MCIRVRYAPLAMLAHPWDADRSLITLPVELDEQRAHRALRRALQELRIAQGEFGARCWCGEPIPLLPRIPQQRRSEVINLGA